MEPQIQKLTETLARALAAGDLITVLTGAGISADSGIPTFRGPEGYWTIGSQNYMPTEMATRAMFNRHPREVWKWYLYRFSICADALPNPGHLALVEMERLLGDRFRLITQNVDGLHLRAGNSPERTFQIHGNLNTMRCMEECSSAVYPLPIKQPASSRLQDLSPEEWKAFTCSACGALTRPHVLFFDEYYDELHYKFDSTLQVAAETSLLITVGTTGTTNLPGQVVSTVLRRQKPIININIEANVFSRAAQESPGGMFLKGTSSTHLPAFVACLEDILDK